MDGQSSGEVRLEYWESAKCISNAEALADFLAPLFGDDDWSDYASKLTGRAHLLAIVALLGESQLVGVKMGYERNRGVFNSWIGGVAPQFRGTGLANHLMTAQHEWAKDAGFRGVETATRQHNRAMGILNLKSGFVVAGLDVVPGSETKVIFYKDLRAEKV